MTTVSVLPVLIAFMAGLCVMRAHEVYAINAWNVGTLKLEPWRSKAAARAIAAVSRAWKGIRHLLFFGAAIGLLVLFTSGLAHAATLHGHTVLTAAIVLGTPAEMRERREKLIHDAAQLNAGGASGFSFKNAEDREKFDAMLTDADAYRVALEDVERGSRLAQLGNGGTLPESQRTQPRERNAQLAIYERGLNKYLRGFMLGDMHQEEREALQSGFSPLTAEQRASMTPEQRDMTTASGANGGFVVPPDTRFYGVIIQAMKFFGGMETVGSEVIETDTAGALPIPMGDDTGNVGSIIPEAKVSGHAGGVSPTLTELVLGGYLYSSKVIKVSWQMLRDPAINIEEYVGGLLGQRLGRIQNTHFTTGIGSGQPYGVSTQAPVGRQSAVGNTTSVPFDDIFRLIHSIDIAYRTQKCKWMLADSSALVLRLAKDGVGRYLWPEMNSAAQSGQPLELGGYGVVINNDMAAMAASAKWATFGDHSYYKIRRIRGITVVRINELYVESGQVGFLAFQSADGGLADAGQHPVKQLQNSAT